VSLTKTSLAAADTVEDFILIARRFREQCGTPPNAVKMSQLTADWLVRDFPVVNEPVARSGIYGIPIVYDKAIPFGQLELVYREL
jgi:hypothetical protein